MTDASAVSRAVQDVSAVVHLAAATSERASEVSNSVAVNVGGGENLIEACKTHDVRRIIVMSSQSTKRPKRGVYGETKRQADQLFETSGLEVTTLKPALIYGPGARGVFANLSRQVERLPIVPVIGTGEQTFQPVWVYDVAAAICACLRTRSTVDRVYDIAGADTVTFKQLVDTLTRRKQGSTKRKIHIPYQLALWIARIGGRLAGFPLTTDNVIGVVQETEIDLEPAIRDFGFSPTTLCEGLEGRGENLPGEHSDALGVVVVGTGRMGLVHASIINTMPEAELVGVMDVKDKMRKFLRSWGIAAPFYTDVGTMLDETHPRVAIVCVPPVFTRPVLTECLKRGIHVLVEKPLANSISNARAIAEQATEQSIVSVGFFVAFQPTFAHARQLLSRGILGGVSKIRAYAFQSLVSSRMKGWRYEKAMSGGGALPIIASHTLFLLYWYFGLPHSIEAELSSPYSEVDDEARVRLSFQDGIEAEFETSWTRPGHRNLMQSIEVSGEYGRLEVRDDRVVLTLDRPSCGYPDGETTVHRFDLPGTSWEVGAEGYFAQDRDFIRSVLDGGRPIVTLEDGLAVQVMLDAIYRAAATNGPVELSA